MYHDEFAKRPTRTRSNGDVDVPAFPLEFGGGLSLGLAASLNPSISGLLLSLGGLLPLVATSFAIALHRAAEFLNVLASRARIIDRTNPPRPHFATISSASTIDPRRFEDSRQFRSK
jgi:hypothetical protein